MFLDPPINRFLKLDFINKAFLWIEFVHLCHTCYNFKNVINALLCMLAVASMLFSKENHVFNKCLDIKKFSIDKTEQKFSDYLAFCIIF